MKQTTTFLFFALCLGSNLFAQQQYVSHTFNQVVNMPCPGNPTVTMPSPKYCQVYQTLNNAWDGPKDPNICIESGMIAGRAAVFLEFADLTRSIFVHFSLPEPIKVELLPDAIGKQSLTWQTPNSVSFVMGDTCAQGICTGAWIGLQVPDSAGTGFNIRRYDQTNNVGSGNYYRTEACLPTERFVGGNFFKEIIWKFTISQYNGSDYISLGDYTHELDSTTWNWGYGICKMRDTVVQHAPNVHHYASDLATIYNYYPTWGTCLVMYEDSTYPDANHISYVEFSPSPPSTVVDTMDISVGSGWGNGNTLVFQPYTSIRGGMVTGDTSRHIVNLINDGTDWCMPGFMEVIMNERTSYIHKNGSISFGGENACLMFRKGSSLVVSAGKQFNYGLDGKGLMGWRTGAKVILEKGATLYFDGRMVLMQNAGETVAEDVEIVLPPESHLVFSKYAQILNFCPLGRKIRVLMKGGSLDISDLKPEYAQHIELVYDEKPATLADNITIMGNPVFDTFEWQYIDDEAKTIHFSLIDIAGKTVFDQVFATQKGVNATKIDVSALPIGCYFARFESGGNKVYDKIIKR